MCKQREGLHLGLRNQHAVERIFMTLWQLSRRHCVRQRYMQGQKVVRNQLLFHVPVKSESSKRHLDAYFPGGSCAHVDPFGTENGSGSGRWQVAAIGEPPEEN